MLSSAASIAVGQSPRWKARKLRSSASWLCSTSTGVTASPRHARPATTRVSRGGDAADAPRRLASTTPLAPKNHTNSAGISQSQSIPACNSSAPPAATKAA